MNTLEALRARVNAVVAQSGAFVRLDHGNALFVSDYPRRAAFGAEAQKAFEDGGFSVEIREGLLYLTPYPSLKEPVRALAVQTLKYGRAATDKRLRQTLAVEMREKRAENIKLIASIMKGTNEYED